MGCEISLYVYKSPERVPIPSQMNPTHISHPVSLRSILILYSHLLLYFPSGLFPSVSPTKILYAFIVKCVLHAHPISQYTQKVYSGGHMLLLLRHRIISCNSRTIKSCTAGVQYSFGNKILNIRRHAGGMKQCPRFKRSKFNKDHALRGAHLKGYKGQRHIDF
jgi:hypothetical protein